MEKTSSDFTVDEIQKLISISNLLGIDIPANIPLSVEFYLDKIIEQLKKIPYCPFPTSFHCIDVAVIKYPANCEPESFVYVDKSILLGRKSNKTKYQFIGGFVDPAETTVQTVKRELMEECNIEIDEEKDYMHYQGSFFIDDERFKNGPHKLTTSFYYVLTNRPITPVAADDIEEIKWFSLNELKKDKDNLLIEQHHQLLDSLKHLSSI